MLNQNLNIFNKNLNKGFIPSNIQKVRILRNNPNSSNSITLLPDTYNNKINFNIFKNNFISEGSFAQVFKLKNSNNGTKRKNLIYKSIISENEEDAMFEYKGLKFQYLLQKILRSKNIDNLKYLCLLHEYGFINKLEDYKNLYAIMDNCGIELGEYILELKESRKLTLEIIIKIMIECTKALQIIHNTEYVHLDVKPQNFLVVKLDNGDIQIKIIDFGCIIKNNKKIEYIIGTKAYMSPEILNETSFNNLLLANIKMDIFSLGCMFFEFLIILSSSINKHIYDGFYICPYTINKRISFKDRHRVNYSKYFAEDLDTIREILVAIGIKSNLIELYISVISRMINPNPEERYSNTEELMIDLMSIRENTTRPSNNGKNGKKINNSLTVLQNAGSNGL
jgi:serine/threonine protein kinase